ncbi:MAG: extracellular solute-binding protein [Firmicutes bacterium]|nr:extracellular solute-binding protein [Bacillota bacterium]
MNTVRLRIWVMPTHQRMATIAQLEQGIQPFLASHPHVAVQWRIVQWNVAWEEFVRSFKEGQAPDVIQVGTTWLAPMAHMGLLRRLPHGMLTGIGSAPLIAPWVGETTRYRGVDYALPWMLDTTCVAVRPDVLARLGVDRHELTTWGHIAGLGETWVQRTRDGRLSSLQCKAITAISPRPEPVTLHRLTPILRSGGWSVSATGQHDLDAAFAYLQSFIESGVVDRQAVQLHPYRLQADFFEGGLYAMMVTSWWEIIRSLDQSGPRLAFSTSTIPVPAGPFGQYAFAGGSLLGVTTQSSHPELAWELIRGLVAPEFLINWALKTGAPPAYAGAFWDHFLEQEDIRILYDTLQVARPYAPGHPLWRSMESRLAQGIGDMVWSLLEQRSDDEFDRMKQTMDEGMDAFLAFGWGL